MDKNELITKRIKKTTVYEYHIGNESGCVEVGGITRLGEEVIWIDPIHMGPVEISLEEAELLAEALTLAIKELKKCSQVY